MVHENHQSHRKSQSAGRTWNTAYAELRRLETTFDPVRICQADSELLRALPPIRLVPFAGSPPRAFCEAGSHLVTCPVLSAHCDVSRDVTAISCINSPQPTRKDMAYVERNDATNVNAIKDKGGRRDPKSSLSQIRSLRHGNGIQVSSIVNSLSKVPRGQALNHWQMLAGRRGCQAIRVLETNPFVSSPQPEATHIRSLSAPFAQAKVVDSTEVPVYAKVASSLYNVWYSQIRPLDILTYKPPCISVHVSLVQGPSPFQSSAPSANAANNAMRRSAVMPPSVNATSRSRRPRRRAAAGPWPACRRRAPRRTAAPSPAGARGARPRAAPTTRA